jgi:hypothetical protein
VKRRLILGHLTASIGSKIRRLSVRALPFSRTSGRWTKGPHLHGESSGGARTSGLWTRGQAVYDSAAGPLVRALPSFRSSGGRRFLQGFPSVPLEINASRLAPGVFSPGASRFEVVLKEGPRNSTILAGIAAASGFYLRMGILPFPRGSMQCGRSSFYRGCGPRVFRRVPEYILFLRRTLCINGVV